MDLNIDKNIENSIISSVGVSMAKPLNNHDDEFSIAGHTNFSGRYGSGTVSLSRPDDNQLNMNVTTSGSIASSGLNLVPNGQREKSGVIIKTGLDGTPSLAAQINGRRYNVSEKNNFIPLSPYATYHIELMNDKNAKDSVVFGQGKSQKVTLYPGNVAVYEPEIKQLITVFGRLISHEGELMSGVSIHNKIGETVTDAEGKFAMDIDLRYPTIELKRRNDDKIEELCQIKLDLKKAKGVIWVGDISCAP